MSRVVLLLGLLAVGGWGLPAWCADPAPRPNIVWIVAEDASPHIGCYGETTIATPHLDALAAGGVQFANAFVTSPVCSPSRSAMVSGMFQTTLGAHHHRSGSNAAKAGGNTAYYDSYRVPAAIKLVPELFADAGYYVVNGGSAKTDYNFIPRRPLYHGRDWSGRREGQPFFAQIQLSGGKARGARVEHPVDPAQVELPPYYADDPLLREDWARYLHSWIKTDREVGAILQRLDEQQLADSTIVFFWTDHGVSHLRGKQFLYDEGLRVPLIVRFPGGEWAGTVRRDLVSHIDVAAASLALAGIPLPDYVQGRPIFAADYQPRTHIVAARDRCDETVDMIRCVRTERYKYIRNFLAQVSHMQPNQYKDGKPITRRMRALHAAGKLNALQARVFAATRPIEELYDLASDPHETHNLAGDPAHAATLEALRRALYQWMVDSGDLGLIPEPILEEAGRRRGSKYAVLQGPDRRRLTASVLATIELGAQRQEPPLLGVLESQEAAVRYWAAVGLGHIGGEAAVAPLTARLDDPSAAVRVAAAAALCQRGHTERALPLLAREVNHANLIVGLYAIRALEQIGPPAHPALPVVLAARESPYEFTRRVARRLTAKLEWYAEP